MEKRRMMASTVSISPNAYRQKTYLVGLFIVVVGVLSIFLLFTTGPNSRLSREDFTPPPAITGPESPSSMLTGAAAGDAGSYNVDTCKRSGWISGATYILTKNLGASDLDSYGSCMLLSANNVVLDCQWHEIIGVNKLNSIGINVQGTGNIIKNCDVRSFYTGIRLPTVGSNELTGNTLRNNNLAGIGLVTGSSKNKIYKNVLYGNTRGIQLNGKASYNIIPANRACNNTQHDVAFYCSGSAPCVGTSGTGNIFKTIKRDDGSPSDNWPINGTDYTECKPNTLSDSDGDKILDIDDNCPAVPNSDQSNFDGDAQGDVCDADDDNDSVPDTNDVCPRTPSGTPVDQNGCFNPSCREWNKTEDNLFGEGEELAFGPDLNLYIIGTASHGSVNSEEIPFVDGWDIWIRKMDSNGNVIWTRRIDYNQNDNGFDDSDFGLGITIDASGNIYYSGTVTPEGTPTIGSELYWISKLDNDGNDIWGRGYDSGLYHYPNKAHSVVLDSVGNVYVTGVKRVAEGESTKTIFTVKLDADGNELWTNYYGQESGDTSYDLTLGLDNNLYLTGQQKFPGPESLMTVQKIDPDGNEIWTKSFGALGNNEGRSIAVDQSGNLYFTGYLSSQFALIKTNPDGNEIWNKTYSGITGAGYGVTVDLDGNVYVTGFENFPPLQGKNIFTRKYDTDGNEIWARRYNGDGSFNNQEGNGIAVNGDGVYVTGYSRIGTESYKIWVQKYCNYPFN